MDADPMQLDNLYPAAGQQLADRERELAGSCAELRRCSGIEGREPPRARPPLLRLAPHLRLDLAHLVELALERRTPSASSARACVDIRLKSSYGSRLRS